MKASSSDAPDYKASAPMASDDAKIREALKILASRMKSTDSYLTQSQDTKDYLRLRIGGLPHEVFGCVFLDNRHRVITTEELFRGTLNGTAVYPREIVKAVLGHNAAAVVFFHNHPSGVPDPSRADEVLTTKLKEALSLIEVRVLDHIIVTADGCSSFSERGLL